MYTLMYMKCLQELCYDAQIWAVAKLNQAPVVFSEDFSDGQVIEGVRFVNPFARDFQVEEWV